MEHGKRRFVPRPEGLAVLRELGWRREKMVECFFDTPQGELSARGIVLRFRRTWMLRTPEREITEYSHVCQTLWWLLEGPPRDNPLQYCDRCIAAFVTHRYTFPLLSDPFWVDVVSLGSGGHYVTIVSGGQREAERFCESERSPKKLDVVLRQLETVLPEGTFFLENPFGAIETREQTSIERTIEMEYRDEILADTDREHAPGVYLDW